MGFHTEFGDLLVSSARSAVELRSNPSQSNPPVSLSDSNLDNQLDVLRSAFCAACAGINRRGIENERVSQRKD